MIFHDYEKVLKQLDCWASEARAVARAKSGLDDKIEILRFQNSLFEVRSKLRLYIFTAEDVSKYVFTTEQENVLVARLPD